MLLNLVSLFTGLALLVWSSDKFVFGASATARSLGVSPLLIGLTIVGFGTSAPEFLVSAISAWNGNPQLAVGNAIGSNIANFALILGISALVSPLIISPRILKTEIPILFFVMLLTLILLLDRHLSYTDGVLLLITMLLVMSWIVYDGLNNRDSVLEKEFENEIPDHIPALHAISWLILGLVLLVISSRMMVWGAVNIAQLLGISDLVIGLSIVAIGTSLPELGASIASVRKKEYDIALGNVLGSNMFNSLGVLGIAGVIKPTEIDHWLLVRDMPLQFFLLLVIFIVAGQWKLGSGGISRGTGTALFLGFVAYQALLFFQSFSG